MQSEFDNYIKDYRHNLDKALSISGYSSDYFAEYKAQKLKKWFPDQVQQSIKILDFGCGDGLMTHYVSQLFTKAQIYGIDPSLKSIETAQRLFPSLTFFVNHEQHVNLNFEDNTFDLIYAAGVFHHIPFDKHHQYIQELCRILKPHGFLVVFELNPLNPLTVLTFKRNPIDQNAHMMMPWYTYRLVKNCGKTTTKFYCFYPKFLSWLKWTEDFLIKVPCGALYATIVQKK